MSVQHVTQVINPVTGRKITVGSRGYYDLVKQGHLPPREVLVIDGKKSLALSSMLETPKVRSQAKYNNVSREEKIKHLRAYREQKDKEKKEKEKNMFKEIPAKEFKVMEAKYLAQKAKYRELKQQTRAPVKQQKAPVKQPKKEESYDSTEESSSLESSS